MVIFINIDYIYLYVNIETILCVSTMQYLFKYIVIVIAFVSLMISFVYVHLDHTMQCDEPCSNKQINK